jgi:hypothetical protein
MGALGSFARNTRSTEERKKGISVSGEVKDRGVGGAWRGKTRRNRELFLVSTHDPPRSSRLVLLLSSVSRRALGKLIPIKASRYASAVVQEVGAEFIVSAARERQERERGGRRGGEKKGSEREEKDTME